MLTSNIVNSIQAFLAELSQEGIPTSFAVVFGSCAKGNENEWSDIDVVVVSPFFDQEYTHKDLDLLWVVASSVDSRIEPIACGESQWREDDVTPIIEIARRDGVVIEPLIPTLSSD